MHGLPFDGNDDICTAAANEVNVEFDSDIEDARQYSVYERQDVADDEAYVIHAISCGIIPRRGISTIYVRKTADDEDGGTYHVYYDDDLDKPPSPPSPPNDDNDNPGQQSPSHTWGSYMHTSDDNDNPGQQSPSHSWGSYLHSSDDNNSVG